MSSIGEAAVEGPSVFLDFLWRRTQAMYSEDVSEDEALECTFWMGGVWRKVEVEVLLFSNRMEWMECPVMVRVRSM
jgi:hypothetical protein